MLFNSYGFLFLPISDSPEVWIALVTLTALEIVLGIDDIIFISILVGGLFLIWKCTMEIHGCLEGGARSREGKSEIRCNPCSDRDPGHRILA